MERFQSLAQRHDQGFKALMEQFRELSHRQHAPSETSHSLSNPPTSGGFVQHTPAPRELCLPPPERYARHPGTCQEFLSQCSLIFELQPSSFSSDRSKIVYLITLMSGRVLSWAMAVWEQESAICYHLEDFMAEVWKVFDSPERSGPKTTEITSELN